MGGVTDRWWIRTSWGRINPVLFLHVYSSSNSTAFRSTWHRPLWRLLCDDKRWQHIHGTFSTHFVLVMKGACKKRRLKFLVKRGDNQQPVSREVFLVWIKHVEQLDLLRNNHRRHHHHHYHSLYTHNFTCATSSFLYNDLPKVNKGNEWDIWQRNDG